MQHRQIPVIGKGHMLHFDAALDILQLRSIFLVLDGGLHAHHCHEPVQSRKAIGEQLREAGELAHGGDEGGNIQCEGNQIPVVHLVLHNIVAAHADDQHVQAAQEKLRSAAEPAHGFVKFPLGGFVNLIGGMEPGILHGLIGKGLGSADAGEAGFDLGIDVARLLLHSDGSLAHALAHAHHHDQENRDH